MHSVALRHQSLLCHQPLLLMQTRVPFWYAHGSYHGWRMASLYVQAYSLMLRIFEERTCKNNQSCLGRNYETHDLLEREICNIRKLKSDVVGKSIMIHKRNINLINNYVETNAQLPPHFWAQNLNNPKSKERIWHKHRKIVLNPSPTQVLNVN